MESALLLLRPGTEALEESSRVQSQPPSGVQLHQSPIIVQCNIRLLTIKCIKGVKALLFNSSARYDPGILSGGEE